jgi:hypothetical protein
MITRCEPFYRDTFQLGSGAERDVYYYVDPESGDTISIHENALYFGRWATGYTGWLKDSGGVDSFSATGPYLPILTKAIWIICQSSNPFTGVSNINAELWQNGGKAYDAAWGSKTLDINLSIGNLSARLVTSGSPSTAPNNPVVSVGIRWRLA